MLPTPAREIVGLLQVFADAFTRPTFWIWRQPIEATPWGRAPGYLIGDRDAVYGRGAS